jgi:hypothetical protein
VQQSNTREWQAKGVVRAGSLHLLLRRCFALQMVVLTVPVVAAVAGSSAAQGQSLTILHTITAPPESVTSARLVFATASGMLQLVPAVVVAAPGRSSVDVLGRVVLPSAATGGSSGVGAFTSLAVLQGGELGAGSKVAIGSDVRRISEITSDPLMLLSSTDIAARLTEQRAVLRTWEGRVQSQAKSLNRLTADVDTIGKVNDIVSVEEQLQAVQVDLERLKGALTAATARFEVLKQQSAPPNYKRREAQLSEQLSELSTALKTKEASATQRVAAASAELQRKLSLIDQTKDQQLAVLQSQLKRLRARRERLQREGR